jgi:transcriptional regulator with XRE-family HTH domain
MISDEKLQELFIAGNIGQRLLIKRKELKLSRTDFAKKLNVSSNTLSKYEKLESIPSPYIIKNIFEILDINIEDFLTERHQHILDVRFLLEEEIDFINQRIKELEQLTRYYEYEKHQVEELLNEDCSFATEFNDIEVDYEFSGNGLWTSEKLYLSKGVYIINLELDTPCYTSMQLFNIVQSNRSNVFHKDLNAQFKMPFIIEYTGYYFIQLDYIKGNWKMALNKETVKK